MPLKLPGILGEVDIFEKSPMDGSVLATYGNQSTYENQTNPSTPQWLDAFNTLSATKWTTVVVGGGTAVITSGALHLQSGAVDGDSAEVYTTISKKLTAGFSCIHMRAMVKTLYSAHDVADFRIGLKAAGVLRGSWLQHFKTSGADNMRGYSQNASGSAAGDVAFVDGIYNIIDIFLTATEVRYYVNEDLLRTSTYYLPTTEDLCLMFKVKADGAAANQQMWVDWVEWYFY